MATITYNEQVLTDIEDAMDKVIAEVGRVCLERVKERTPVRTGYARSRWGLEVGSHDFTLNNDAEYISYLEDGSSDQAPSGMLAITMMEVPDITDAAVAKYRKE